MRITTETQSQQNIYNLQLSYARLTNLQNQITTGQKINNPSDDPVTAVQILENNTQNNQLSTDLTSIQSATGVLQTSADALTQAQKSLTSAINAAQTAANVTTGSNQYATLAAQVNTALTQLLSSANTQLSDGTYIFGGTANTVQPFAVTSSDPTGQVTGVAYKGNQQSSQVIVAKGQTVNTLLPGSSVFQPTVGGPTSYSGSTGAQPGNGIDTASGQGTLLVQHTLTTISGASGVSAGTSSPSGDTILGPVGSSSLTINDISGTGAGGTISLNGGPAIAFTNTDNNLKLTGPHGEVIYVDTTSVTPGFKGSVSLGASGTLSTDGGTTTTPINFSSSQAITDNSTGGTTNVNSTNIRIAGQEQLNYPGQTDVFQSLITLRDTIANTQGLSASDRTSAINQQLGQLQKISSSLATPLGAQASQAQFLSNLKTRTTALQTSVQQATSTLQSTDIASVLVQLQQEQTLYQAGLQIAANTNNLSLVNFIK